MTSVAHGQGREPDQDSDPLAGLLERASRGDEGAWREIIELFGRRVFALARSRCRNTDVAEDITQSVFATVAAKLRQGLYAEKGRFESWLFRVTMNRVRDEVRRTRRQPVVPDSGDAMMRQPDRASSPPEEVEPGVGTLAALRVAMAGLSESDREVVELRHHAGLSFKQIADILDEPVGTLLARHHRALRKLRDIMERDGSEQASEAEEPPRRPGSAGLRVS